jgi:hypothetical protein
MRKYFQENTATDGACGNEAERKYNLFHVHVRIAMPHEDSLRIAHLRDCLGWGYQQVAHSGDAIVIQHYSARELVMVLLWEWRFSQQLEADIRAGRCPWETGPDEHQRPWKNVAKAGWNWLGPSPRAR